MGWYGDHIWELDDSERVALFQRYRHEFNHRLPMSLQWWAWNLVASDQSARRDLNNLLYAHWKILPQTLPPPKVVLSATVYYWWLTQVFDPKPTFPPPQYM